MIQIEKTKLAWKVTLPFQHHDERGSIYQPFDQEHYFRVDANKDNAGVFDEVDVLNNSGSHEYSTREWKYRELHWRQENVIIENYGALRGLHCHSKAWLLMTCLSGDVVIGLVEPETHRTERVVFNSRVGGDIYQILVPPGIANGHCALSDNAVFHYIWSTRYEDEIQTQYPWNAYGIDWGVKEPILSERDR